MVLKTVFAPVAKDKIVPDYENIFQIFQKITDFWKFWEKSGFSLFYQKK